MQLFQNLMNSIEYSPYRNPILVAIILGALTIIYIPIARYIMHDIKEDIEKEE